MVKLSKRPIFNTPSPLPTAEEQKRGPRPSDVETMRRGIYPYGITEEVVEFYWANDRLPKAGELD